MNHRANKHQTRGDGPEVTRRWPSGVSWARKSAVGSDRELTLLSRNSALGLMVRSLLLVGAAILSPIGCRDVERFSTGQNGAYCGALVGASFASDGLMPDNSVAVLKLKLTLDTQKLTQRPGVLSSNDILTGLCAPNLPLFSNASVRTVQKAQYDVISAVQLTPDHDKDIFAWVDSTCQGTFLSIVSLIDDGTVELRLFKPAADTVGDASADKRPGFGLFKLNRHDDGCDF
jgi:hypothetical protein